MSKKLENVSYFWNYMTGYKDVNTSGPRVNIVSSVNYLNNGGVMQIDFDSNGSYNHSVVLA